MNQPRSVIIQERRHLVRSGLAALLASEGGLEVAAVATADELVAAVSATAPDVAVIELDAPWDVKSTVAQVRAAHPAIRIVALHEGRLSDLGRRPFEPQIDALAAYGGGTAAILAAICAAPSAGADHLERRQLPSRSLLTPREQEVLRLLADGLTASDCADRLGVSPKTIDNHKQRIFSKLGVQNQAHAVALAHRIGLLGRTRGPRSANG